MKNKTLQRVLAFCLALCFCFTLGVAQPMEAKALAVESWVMYAIITGLAAMGITFTVAGGVDAMIQAMEEKVDEYEVVYPSAQFIQAVLNGVKLVPSPSGGTDPEGNDLYNLLFTATIWDALEKFVDWLTGDGGWNKGEQVQKTVYDKFILSSNDMQYYNSLIVGKVEVIESLQYSNHCNILNNPTIVQDGMELGDDIYLQIYNSTGYNNGVLRLTHDISFSSSDPNVWLLEGNGVQLSSMYQSRFPNAYTIEDVIGSTLVQFDNSAFIYPAVVFNDNTCAIPNYSSMYDFNTELSDFTESYTVDVPVEIPRLTPEQTQGVMMQQLEIASPEIVEWANMVEETFIDTGTIPQPEPEVVADPDYAPTPTPIPSPVVPEPDTPTYTDVETLGLPALGDALMGKFPFCLVTDISRVINIFTTTRETPKWEVDILAPLADRIPFQGDTTLKLDFSEYEEVGTITRWVTTIGYVLFLLLVTKQMITW